MIGKRLFDIIASTAGLFLLSPLLLIIALLVRVKIGPPVLFWQKRPGLKGKPFFIYKFRTMTDERDADGNLLSDERRMTGLGTFLRSVSVDELPELITSTTNLFCLGIRRLQDYIQNIRCWAFDVRCSFIYKAKARELLSPPLGQGSLPV